LSTAENVSRSAAVTESATVAPQIIAHAKDLHRQAAEAYERGEIAKASILGERAVVAFERAAVLARLARAELLAAEAQKKASESAEEQRLLDAERERLDADIAAIEQMILVVRDARAITPTIMGDPGREAARMTAARAIVVDARLLCVAAKLLGRPMDGLESAESEVGRLEDALAQWPKPVPIDDAQRIRANCLSLLTLARRSGSGALPADMVLTELSQVSDINPVLDDRGVAVVVEGYGPNNEKAKARVDALAKVAAKHTQYPVLVVSHTRAKAPKAVQDTLRDQAEAIVRALEAAGVDRARLGQVDAGPHRPMVHDPIPPPANSKNDRVEVVLVVPSL